VVQYLPEPTNFRPSKFASQKPDVSGRFNSARTPFVPNVVRDTVASLAFGQLTPFRRRYDGHNEADRHPT